MSTRFYIVWDGRAELGGTEDAMMLESIGERAHPPRTPFWRELSKDWGLQRAQLYSYNVEPDENGVDVLVDERLEGTIR